MISAILAVTGCRTSRNGEINAGSADADPATPVRVEKFSQPDRGGTIRSEKVIGNGAVTMIANAVAYRMSGDFADNVPVTLASDGSLASYPAPTDLCEGSTPLALADGWWLDRRGVGSGTVFTRYTYRDYAALGTAPSPSQLLGAVIPGARVTAVMRLPMTLQEAVADTAAVNAFIRSQRLSK